MTSETPKKRKTKQRENSAGGRVERWVPVATRLDRPMREFEQHLLENPYNLFMTALEMYPEDSKYHKFLVTLCDPSVAHRTLAWKARQCGITLRELMETLNQGQNLAGLIRIGSYVPKIMEQQAQAAMGVDKPCEKCKGEKTIIAQKDGEPAEIPCPDCYGIGTFRTLGNDKAIDRTLQMAGVLGKDGGMNVTVNTQVNNNGVSMPVEQITSDIERIIDVGVE